jgi:hypothetical protein
VATYACAVSDSTCLDATTTHSVNEWSFTPYPNDGLLETIAFPDPTELQFMIGGDQYYFNTQSNTFTSTAPDAGLSQCWSQWDAFLSGQNIETGAATPSIEQAFETTNPQCMTP